MEKVSDLEKKLIQATKEVELLKVMYAPLNSANLWLDPDFSDVHIL